MSKPIVHCNCCNTDFHLPGWSMLQYVGIQRVCEGPNGEPPAKYEMRNCGCGSTLSLEVERYDPHGRAWVLVGAAS